MRLVGIALFTAWLLAWLVAPKGELARPTSTVGGLAITGDDEAAVAWLEVRHALSRTTEVLHVATVDMAGAITPRMTLDGRNNVGIRLANAGGGRYVLVSEHRRGRERWFGVRPFGRGAPERVADLPLVRLAFNASAWEVAAAGDWVAILEQETASGGQVLHLLDAEGHWRSRATDAPRSTLLGGGAGAVALYTVGRTSDRVTVLPASGTPLSLEVSRPFPIVPAQAGPLGPGSPAAALDVVARDRVISVVALPGGYARLARVGRWLFADGIRAGVRFTLPAVPPGGSDPRLIVDEAGRLALIDANEGKGALYLERIEEVARPNAAPWGRVSERAPQAAFEPPVPRHFGWAPWPLQLGSDAGERGYTIFNVTGRGASALSTRGGREETLVTLERFPTFPIATDGTRIPAAARGAAVHIGPARHHLPDHRPILRVLALLPLATFALSLAGALRLRRRLVRVLPAASRVPLAEGPVAVEAHLALDADAPHGALRMRRAGQPLLLFLDGAEVLRASDMRGRSEPRGDAVDVASGAPVVATGRFERGALFRGEDAMHAGRGDLVVVGCTLAEARARLTRRVLAGASLLAAAAALIVRLAG